MSHQHVAHPPVDSGLVVILFLVGAFLVLGIASGLATFLIVIDEPLPGTQIALTAEA